MCTDRQFHDACVQILDLEVRVERAEQRIRDLADLLDSMVVFLKSAHGGDFPALVRVEHAAERALQP